MSTSEHQNDKGKKQRQIHIRAIFLSVVPMYAALILILLSANQQDLTMEGFIAFLLINGLVSLTVIYLLQRYLLGERFLDLNLKGGKWWQDALASLILVILTLGVLPVILRPLLELLPPQEMGDLANLFNGLAESWWLAAFFLGPVLIIGVGIEEVTRTFFLKHAWKAWPSQSAQWINLFLSAVVFGLAHLYQGPAGMVKAGIYGLIMALYYRFFGRLYPMVIAHFLHDFIQFVMVITMIRNGIVPF